MKRVILAAALSIAATPLLAALPVGEPAPDFETKAALNGAETAFKLSAALQNGPVVVYFYPKANTKGCDVEAHEFSEAMEDFQALGATVIGVSADDIETLKVYSANPETCAGKLQVASDASGDIMRAYDAVAAENPANAAIASKLEGLADRTSYVVAPDGKILFVHNDLGDPLGHVSGSLEAVRVWSATKPKKPE